MIYTLRSEIFRFDFCFVTDRVKPIYWTKGLGVIILRLRLLRAEASMILTLLEPI